MQVAGLRRGRMGPADVHMTEWIGFGDSSVKRGVLTHFFTLLHVHTHAYAYYTQGHTAYAYWAPVCSIDRWI